MSLTFLNPISMKSIKYLLMIAVLCLLLLNVKGQITFEDSLVFPSNNISGLVRLQYAGDKYFYQNDTTSIEIYNLNHTLYKSIPLPNINLYGGESSYTVWYISETLFDTDSTTIEYMLTNIEHAGSVYHYHIHVYDENGNSLFFKDSVIAGGSIDGEYGYINKPVFNTDTGTKMMLMNGPPTNQLFIYNLPGTLYIPCDCYTSSGVPLSVEENQGYADCILKNYPNPSGDKTIIEYKLPKGVHKASLKILSLYGEELKKYTITDMYSNIELDSSELSSGNYFYQVVLPNGKSVAKKMMVIH
jgi:hypothetical protein